MKNSLSDIKSNISIVVVETYVETLPGELFSPTQGQKFIQLAFLMDSKSISQRFGLPDLDLYKDHYLKQFKKN